MRTKFSCREGEVEGAPDWLPQRAIDSHVHVIDPEAFPYSSGCGYRPCADETGSAAELEGILRSSGLSGALIVQPSCYGTDNRALLAALGPDPGCSRGIAVVSPDVPLEDLERLAAKGVVGIRFNVVNMGDDTLARAAGQLSLLEKLGLIAQIQCPALQLPSFMNLLLDCGTTIVLDHLGYPDISRGLDEPGFRAVCRLARRGGVYVKLSGAFRLSRAAFPHDDVAPFAEAILEAYGPDHCVWGSDWPFIGVARRPSYSETLETLARWVPDGEERRRVLVSTPRSLFGLAGTAVMP